MTAVTEIRLPQFGMGMQEGTIIAWFKREGDHVAAGEVVAEIEAEKVTEELVATGGGVLQRILVPEGDTAAVNELLAVIVPAPPSRTPPSRTPPSRTPPRRSGELPPRASGEPSPPWIRSPAAGPPDPRRPGPLGRSRRAPGDWLPNSASTSTRLSAPAPAAASQRTMSPPLQPETPPPRPEHRPRDRRRDRKRDHGRFAVRGTGGVCPPQLRRPQVRPVAGRRKELGALLYVSTGRSAPSHAQRVDRAFATPSSTGRQSA